MPKLRERVTGSVVNVPEEKVANVLALGLYDLVEDKAPAKKSASSKSDK